MSVLDTLSQLRSNLPDPLDPPASQESIERVFEYAWHRFNAFDERSGALKRRYRRIREAIIMITWLTTFLAVLAALSTFGRVFHLLAFGLPAMLIGYAVVTAPFDKLRSGNIRAWVVALWENIVARRMELLAILLVMLGMIGILALIEAGLAINADGQGPRREMFKVMLVILPLLSTGLLTFAGRFEAGIAWVGFRLVAESIRREIYELRVKAGLTRLTRSDLEKLRQHVLKQRTRLDEMGIAIPLWGDRYEPGEELIAPNYTDDDDDDGYSPMSVDEYVNYRVIHQANWYRSRIQKDYHATRIFRAWILFIGGLGAFLAAVDYGEFVAVTVAGVTALQAWLGLREHEYSYNIHVRTLLQLQDRIASYYINLKPICDKHTKTEAEQEAIVSYVVSVENVLEEERNTWQQSVLQGQEATEASIAQLVTSTASDWKPEEDEDAARQADDGEDDDEDDVIEAEVVESRVTETQYTYTEDGPQVTAARVTEGTSVSAEAVAADDTPAADEVIEAEALPPAEGNGVEGEVAAAPADETEAMG